MDINVYDLFLRLATDLDLDPQTRTYVLSRIKSEGVRFVTSVLPKLSKTLLYALEVGDFRLARSADGVGFTEIAWKGGLLRYFRGFLLKIFESNGKLRAEPCVVAIYALRQFCEYAYKLALGFTDEQLTAAESKFVETEKEVASTPVDAAFVDRLRKDLETYYPRIANATLDSILADFKPRPGSGTFSTKLAPKQDLGSSRPSDVVLLQIHGVPLKVGYYQRRGIYHVVDSSISGSYKPYPSCPKGILPRYKGFDGLGPLLEYDTRRGNFRLAGYKNPFSTRGGYGVQSIVEPVSEVLFVPKDSRGPRTIVREHYDLLVHQMAFFDFMTHTLERDTCGHIMFSDQNQNKLLARDGSLNGTYSTLDLAEASDRVSHEIISRLFTNCPGLRVMLNRYRTKFALLPSGMAIRLAKVAGMGSGFTFPSMALLIYLAICRQIVDDHHVPYTKAQQSVWVYGDDIIVSSRYTSSAHKAINRVNLKVNTAKSYSAGRFRESCGGDYFNGNDVTPVRAYFRSCCLTAHDHIINISGSFDSLAIERHCRELVRAGLKATSDFLYGILERRIGGKLPLVAGESPVLGRYTLRIPEYPMKGSGDYAKVRVLTAHVLTKQGFEDPYVHLSSKLISRPQVWLHKELGIVPQGSDLGQYSVPRTVTYKWRTISAFRLMG